MNAGCAPRCHCWLALTFLLMAASVHATERCAYEHVDAGGKRLGNWINADNWLQPGPRRATLATATLFMPATRMEVTAAGSPTVRSAGDFEHLPATDPTDGSRRSLGFLLDHRIDADAIVVLRNGQRVIERYWNESDPRLPRLLLSGTRPVLSMLGAIAISQGRLAADKSVVRPVAALSDSVALRKLSARRLLEGTDGYSWSLSDRMAWQRAGGWTAATGDGVRAWLVRDAAWSPLAANSGLPPAEGRPEDELLSWAIAESGNGGPGRMFCEQLFATMKPEDAALWIKDAAGHHLAAGLALTPRDHAKLGQLMLDARTSGKHGRIPEWLIEAVLAPTGGAGDAGLAGLPAGSTMRYGFVRLGGRGNRVALIGPYGNSLYVDFDQRLVVAIGASHADASSPLLLATLYETWHIITASLQGKLDRSEQSSKEIRR